MGGRISDLNKHLYDQLDRLARENLSSDAIEQEVKRTDAIVAVSDQILQSSRLQLAAAKLFAEHGTEILPHLPLIGSAVGTKEASK